MESNGFGPAWLPVWVRRLMTKFGLLFFDEASWARHDEGYARGYPARHVCDRKFLQAMLRDASHARTTLKVAVSTSLAWAVWAAVRLLGWVSFNWKGKTE